MRVNKFSRRWIVLNYVVADPNVWTCRAIADDLGDNFDKITDAAISLRQRGMIVRGEKVGRSRVLIPTPAGVKTLYQTLSR